MFSSVHNHDNSPLPLFTKMSPQSLKTEHILILNDPYSCFPSVFCLYFISNFSPRGLYLIHVFYIHCTSYELLGLDATKYGSRLKKSTYAAGIDHDSAFLTRNCSDREGILHFPSQSSATQGVTIKLLHNHFLYLAMPNWKFIATHESKTCLYSTSCTLSAWTIRIRITVR